MTDNPQPGCWEGGPSPANVSLGDGTLVTSEFAFKRFHGERADALVVGRRCTMDGVQFAVGRNGRVSIGDYCYFTNAVLLAELEIRIGSYVLIGWNVTVADTDFHPLDPALRIEDAIACSPLGHGRPRPELTCRPVIIEDDAWIGPNATILKGVRIGAGAVVEAGAVVTEDVLEAERVMGNPARPVDPS